MMPRNPANARHTISLRLPPDLLDRIDSEATKRILGRTKFVELLLVAALDRLGDVPGRSSSAADR